MILLSNGRLFRCPRRSNVGGWRRWVLLLNLRLNLLLLDLLLLNLLNLHLDLCLHMLILFNWKWCSTSSGTSLAPGLHWVLRQPWR